MLQSRPMAESSVPPKGDMVLLPLSTAARAEFYCRVVASAPLNRGSSVLAVCAGGYDRSVMLTLGLEDVVISNVDDSGEADTYAPYRWSRQDAEALTYPDDSFDWVTVHAGLHHCASPHRGLCEMLRVAREGIIVVEARDSFLMRAAVKFGLTVDFETEQMVLSGDAHGGLRNGPIPNYVYRWTEREVEKTVASFLPQYQHAIAFHYGLAVPFERASMSRNPAVRLGAPALAGIGAAFERLAPRQCNRFGFVVMKRGRLQPWIRETQGGFAFDLDAGRNAYDPAKYRPNGPLIPPT